jgi:hypothetical protein
LGAFSIQFRALGVPQSPNLPAALLSIEGLGETLSISRSA